MKAKKISTMAVIVLLCLPSFSNFYYVKAVTNSPFVNTTETEVSKTPQTEKQKTRPAEKAGEATVRNEADKSIKETQKSGTWGTVPWSFDNGVLTLGIGEFPVHPGATVIDAVAAPWRSFRGLKTIKITGPIVVHNYPTVEFSRLEELENIEGLSYLNTSQVTNMGHMFWRSRKLTSLDLSHFDTKNVQNMKGMFLDTGLQELDLSNFNTSKVTNMEDMFRETHHLTSVNLSSFDTGNVENMMNMFLQTGVTKLDLSHFDTKKVLYVSAMFTDAWNLTSLDISSFNQQGQIVDGAGALMNIRHLKELTVGKNTFPVFESLQDPSIPGRYWQNVGTGTVQRPNGKYKLDSFILNFYSHEYPIQTEKETWVWREPVVSASYDQPGVLGQVIAPADEYVVSNPEFNTGTTWPKEAVQTNLQKQITREINYLDKNTGKELAPKVEQTVTFRRNALVNEFTGEFLGYDTDNDNQKNDIVWADYGTDDFDAVVSPDLKNKGYAESSIPKVESQEIQTDYTGDSVIKVNVYYDLAESTITYHLNDGSGKAVQKLSSQNQETQLLGFDKLDTSWKVPNGHTFEGWALTAEEQSNEKLYQPDELYLLNKDTDLYARYKDIHYKVIFNTNGGRTVLVENDFDYNSLVPEPAVPTKAGYTFEGWYESLAKTTRASHLWDFDVDKITRNIKLDAKWKANTDTKYKVEYYVPTENGYKIQETANLTGTTDTEVKAQIKNFAGYVYDDKAPEGKLSGTISGDGSLVLKVYYRKLPPKVETKIIKKTVHYVDESGNKLEDDFTTNTSELKKNTDPVTDKVTYEPETVTLGHQDNPVIKGYKVKNSPKEVTSDQTVKFDDKDTEYTVVYEKLPPVVETKTIKKTVHYVDESGNKLADDFITKTGELKKTTDLITDQVTYDPESATLGHQDNPNIKGYKVKTSPNEATSDQTVKFGDKESEYTVVYEKLPIPALITVKYVDSDGKEIAKSETLNGNIGETYKAEKKDISGYTFKEVQGAETGKFTEKAQTVTYIYRKNPLTQKPTPVAGAPVTVKYVDNNGKEIAKSETLNGNIGETYKAEKKDISGYTFKEVQGAETGKFTDKAQTVTYVYSKNPLPQKPEKPSSSAQATRSDSSSTSKQKNLPNTGDNQIWMTGLELLGIALLGMVLGMKKREKR